LHAFGNLALVTPEFNTSLSNREFSRKQKEFKRITRLLLNRTLEDVDDWDEERILARGKNLFDVARRRWPHPTSPPSLDSVPLDMRADAVWTRATEPEDDAEEPPIDVESARTLLDAFAQKAIATSAVD
jgi:hypothetical protein